MTTKTREKGIPELTFGERLGLARKKAGLTQAQMADKLVINGKKVAEATIAKWETDGGQPRDQFTVIEQWSDLTGVREDWLIFGYDANVSGRFTKPGTSTPKRDNDRGATRPPKARPKHHSPRHDRAA